MEDRLREQEEYAIGDAVMKLPFYSTPTEDLKVLIGKTVIPIIRADMQREIKERMDWYFELAPNSDSYLRILMGYLHKDLKSGTFSKGR